MFTCQTFILSVSFQDEDVLVDFRLNNDRFFYISFFTTFMLIIVMLHEEFFLFKRRDPIPEPFVPTIEPTAGKPFHVNVTNKKEVVNNQDRVVIPYLLNPLNFMNATGKIIMMMFIQKLHVSSFFLRSRRSF